MNIYDAKGTTLSNQYFEVGSLQSPYIVQAVTYNRRRRSAAYRVRQTILQRIYVRLMHENIFREFYLCLTAWARGAGVSPYEALELLDDNTGCQTVIARYQHGIVLIHSEEELEDIAARMTAPQIISFHVDGETKYALTYNNLMPGAAVYGWGTDYAIAIDALFLTEDGVEHVARPILANIVSWLLWRGTAEQLAMSSAIQLIRDTGTCVDGYTANIIRRGEKGPEAYKLTFARDAIEGEQLPEKTGSYLRQLNIIDPQYGKDGRPIAEWQLSYRRFYRGYWNYYKERLCTLDRDIALYLPYTHTTTTDHTAIHTAIQHELSTTLAPHYMNEVVGALCTTIIDSSQMSTAIGLVRDAHLDHIEYF